MKIKFLISLILILGMTKCIELAGFKFEINEEMANATLYHFYPDLNEIVKDMDIEDIHIATGINIRNVKAKVINFTPEKVQFKIKENGINIHIDKLSGYFIGDLKISCIVVPFQLDINKYINSFSLDANILVTSKTVNGSLYPDAEFIGNPKADIDFSFYISLPFGIGHEIESAVINGVNDAVNDFLKKKSNGLLKKALDLIPMNITIDEYKGYYIDYSLVNPIKMKNGYLEVNSYALLYNIKYPKTKQKKRLALSYIPNIIKNDNYYQLLISQYSINSALYTFFQTDQLSLTLNSDLVNLIISVVLPGLYVKYGDGKLTVQFKTVREGELELNENGVLGKIYGQIIIKVQGTGEIVFQCLVDLLAEVEIIVKNKVTITGNIHSLSIKIPNIDINKCSTDVSIEENINIVANAVIPMANQIIEKDIKFTLPIFFKEIKITHKKQYIDINYMLRKEVYFETLNSTFNEVLTKLKYTILQEDKNKIIQAVQGAYDALHSFISKYITDIKELKELLYGIIDDMKRLVTGMGENSCLEQLRYYIKNINKYSSNVPFLSSLVSDMDYFYSNNKKYTPIQNKENQLVIDNIRGNLKSTALGMVCRAQDIMKQLVNEGNTYFIYYEQSINKCVTLKGDIIYSLYFP